MKVVFKTDDVLTNLRQVASIVNSRNSMPILDTVLFDCSEDCMTMTACDSEMWLSMKCNIVSCDENKKFCINAQDIVKVLTNLGGTTVTLTYDEVRQIASFNYGSGKFTLPCSEAENYPLSNEDDTNTFTYSFTEKQLLRAIEKVSFASGDDGLRPVMNGVHFDFFEEGLVTVATDGRKLARYRDENIKHDDNLFVIPQLTLPNKVSDTLKTIMSNVDTLAVSVVFNEKYVRVTNDTIKLVARLIDGRFPNYDSVIPKFAPQTAMVSKDAFLTALRRVLPLSNVSSALIALKFDANTLTLVAQDVDLSKYASETMSCEGLQSSITIGFKGNLLMEAIKNIDDEFVAIELTDPSKACVFYAKEKEARDTYMSMLMPMMITND